MGTLPEGKIRKASIGVVALCFTEAFFNPMFRTVKRNCRTESGEIDLILEIERLTPFWMEYGSDILVECKNWTKPADLKEAAAFESKARQLHAKLAFFVSFSGFSPDAHRHMLNVSASRAGILLVPLDGHQIQTALRRAEDVEEFLKNAIRKIKYTER